MIRSFRDREAHKMFMRERSRKLPPTMKKFKPIHPGEVLREEFLKPMNLSQNQIARALAVDPRRINEIVLGKRAVTADTALRLARYFGTSAKFWMGLQADYDLDVASDALANTLTRHNRPLAAQTTR